MPLTLYLVRHGETEYNKDLKLQGRGIDASLNDKGRDQAGKIANYFHSKDISQLYSSSLKRSVETSIPVSEVTAVSPERDNRLDEMDFGSFEGKLISEVQGDVEYYQNQWKSGKVNLPLPGGESPREVFDRANSAVVERLYEEPEGGQIYIIHGRLIRILLSVWLGYGLDNMHKVHHQNGAINVIEYDGDTFSPVELNYAGHLE